MIGVSTLLCQTTSSQSQHMHCIVLSTGAKQLSGCPIVSATGNGICPIRINKYGGGGVGMTNRRNICADFCVGNAPNEPIRMSASVSQYYAMEIQIINTDVYCTRTKTKAITHTHTRVRRYNERSYAVRADVTFVNYFWFICADLNHRMLCESHQSRKSPATCSACMSVWSLAGVNIKHLTSPCGQAFWK